MNAPFLFGSVEVATGVHRPLHLRARYLVGGDWNLVAMGVYSLCRNPMRDANGRLPERPKGADCKSVGVRLRRFESYTCHTRKGPLICENGSGALSLSDFVLLSLPRCRGRERRAVFRGAVARTTPCRGSDTLGWAGRRGDARPKDRRAALRDEDHHGVGWGAPRCGAGGKGHSSLTSLRWEPGTAWGFTRGVRGPRPTGSKE